MNNPSNYLFFNFFKVKLLEKNKTGERPDPFFSPPPLRVFSECIPNIIPLVSVVKFFIGKLFKSTDIAICN